MTPTETTPFHLAGNYAPVADEWSAVNLPVLGSLPPELDGMYVRNGPNPAPGRVPITWFIGDGMLHGVRIRGGRAEWYRNRWVRTKALDVDGSYISFDDEGAVDRTVGVANTHVICHAGRILTLVESSFPTQVTGDLETIGPYDFHGRLTTAMTAHPKRCPVTGELLAFGYGFMPPYLTYHRISPEGDVVHSQEIPVPGPTMMHDFSITEKSVVWMDLPIVFDLARALEGRIPYVWSDDYGARLGVMPRTGSSHHVRWFDIDPCYVFHTANAREDAAGVITVDVVRYPETWRDDPGLPVDSSLWRWTIDPAARRVREERLVDRPVEFPRIDDRRVGLAHRYTWLMSSNRDAVSGTPIGQQSLIKHDTRTGHTEDYNLPAGQTPGEPVFVPAAPSCGEDEGWVLTYVYDRGRNCSDLVILDAHDWAAPPVARIRLPQRVPEGFHGSWIDARNLQMPQRQEG